MNEEKKNSHNFGISITSRQCANSIPTHPIPIITQESPDFFDFHLDPHARIIRPCPILVVEVRLLRLLRIIHVFLLAGLGLE